MSQGYGRCLMYVLAVTLVISGVAGCASRASDGSAEPPAASSGDPGADALVYPGAEQLEVPELAASEWLTHHKLTYSSPPLKVPDETPLAWYLTTDDKSLVKEHYAAALPEDGWTFVHEWETVFSHVTSWARGSDRLALSLQYDLSEAAIANMNKNLGLNIPSGFKVWIIVWRWTEE